MIKSIQFTNLKGSTGKVELTPRTVITGGNFAGKSTVLQAITLALNGWLPSVGKTSAATFQLASAGEMAVELTADGGTIKRTWKQSGKSVRSKSDSDGVVPALNSLIADTFIAAKPADRLAMLAQCSGGDWTALDAATAQTRRAYGITVEGETVLEQADETVSALEEAAKISRARKVQFEKTLSGLVELAAEDPVTPPPDTSAPVADAMIAAQTAARAVQSLEAVENDSHEATDQLEALIAEYPEAGEPLPSLAESADERERLAGRLKDKTADLDQVNAMLAGIDQHMKVEPPIACMLARLEEITITAEEAQSLVDEAKNAANEAGIRAATLDAGKKELRMKLAKAQDISNLPCCPTCQSVEDGWRDRVTASLQDQVEAITEAVEIATGKMAAAKDKVADASVLWSDVMERDKLRLYRDRYKAAQREVVKRPALIDRKGVLLLEITELEEKRSAIDATVRDYDRKAKLIRQAELLLARRDAGRAAGEKLQSAMEEHQNALATVAALQAAHEAASPARLAWRTAQGREKDLDACRVQAEEEAKKLGELTAAISSLNTIKASVMHSLFEPIVRLTAEMSGPIGSALVLHPVTGGIGRYAGLTFIPFCTMSGAEQLVAVAALQTALAARGSRILILDEVSRMTDEVREAFIGMLEEMMHAGKIDQVILVDLDASQYGPEWSRVEMGQEAAV